jgi:hypothetical protein
MRDIIVIDRTWHESRYDPTFICPNLNNAFAVYQYRSGQIIFAIVLTQTYPDIVPVQFVQFIHVNLRIWPKHRKREAEAVQIL